MQDGLEAPPEEELGGLEEGEMLALGAEDGVGGGDDDDEEDLSYASMFAAAALESREEEAAAERRLLQPGAAAGGSSSGSLFADFGELTPPPPARVKAVGSIALGGLLTAGRPSEQPATPLGQASAGFGAPPGSAGFLGFGGPTPPPQALPSPAGFGQPQQQPRPAMVGPGPVRFTTGQPGACPAARSMRENWNTPSVTSTSPSPPPSGVCSAG